MKVGLNDGGFVARARLHRASVWGLYACLVAMLLVEGGNPWPAAEAALIGVAVLLAVSALEPPRNARLGRFRQWVLAYSLALVAYGLFQVLVGGPLAHPVWETLREQGVLAGFNAISLAPGQAPWGLLRMMVPYAVFLVSLSLLQYEPEIVSAWTLVMWITTGFAIYGIVQLLLFPDWLLFRPKPSYTRVLTGVFVNRNTAATFLGMGMVVCLCLLRWETRSGRRLGFWAAPWRGIGGFVLSRKAVLICAFCVLQATALGMTGSRGGLLATGASVFAVVVLLDFKPLRGTLVKRLMVWAGLGVALLLAADLAAGRALFRLHSAGTDARFCAFASTWKAAIANLPFGSGIGSFEDVFPAFRGPACGILGIYDKAHNSYLEGFLEMGFAYPVFLLLGLAGIGALLVRGYYGRREHRPFVVGGIGVTLLVALHALVDFSLQIPAVAAFYAMLLATALSTALGRQVRAGPQPGRPAS